MELKVISFNIRCCDDPNGHAVVERAPRLADAVIPYDADLIGFQEYKPRWEEHIEKYFGDNYEIFNKYRDDERRESAPILWKKDKFECLEKGYFWLSDTPDEPSDGWDVLGHKRICEYAILMHKESGKKFNFMNTHYGFSDDCQIKSSKLIAKKAAELSKLPTFVTGDFNMTPDSLGYAELTRHLADVNKLTANDTRATFHGYDPKKYTKEHIDYCFIADGVKPIHRELIDKTYDGKYPSDHYGLFIKLEI